MKTFISYRRDDSQHPAGRIYDRLRIEFGSNNVCMDVDSFPVGTDFRTELHSAIDRCDILLAIIGDRWLEAHDADGNLRLQNPNDFVRIEIETALSKKIPVIPVLVGERPMPAPDELPESMRALAFRNGVMLRPGVFFYDDVGRLLDGARRVVEESKYVPTGLVKQAPPITRPQRPPASPAESRGIQRLMICLLICVLLGAFWYGVNASMRLSKMQAALRDTNAREDAYLKQIADLQDENRRRMEESLQVVPPIDPPASSHGRDKVSPVATPVAKEHRIELTNLYCERPINLVGPGQITMRVTVDGVHQDIKPNYPDNFEGKPCKTIKVGEAWQLSLQLEFDQEISVTFEDHFMIPQTIDKFLLNADTIEQGLPELRGKHTRLRWRGI